MSDIGQQLDGAEPRHEPAGGVVGFAGSPAAFASFDDDTVELALNVTDVPDAGTDDDLAASAAGNAVELRPATFAAVVVAAGTDRTGGLAGGGIVARTGGATIPDRRRLRGAVLACAALALTVAAGVGVAAFNQGPPSGEALSPTIPVPTQPVDPDFSTGASPGIDPVRGGDPAVVGADFPGAPGFRDQGAADPITRDGEDEGSDDSDSVDWWDSDSEPSDPDYSSLPPAPQPPSPVYPSGLLDASIANTDEAWTLGRGGYSATVTVANPGALAVTGWQVTLTVPGGNKVRKVEGVTVSQDDEDVVFTPQGSSTIPAGSSVTFTFQVNGVLAAEPTDCTIDSRPCT